MLNERNFGDRSEEQLRKGKEWREAIQGLSIEARWGG